MTLPAPQSLKQQPDPGGVDVSPEQRMTRLPQQPSAHHALTIDLEDWHEGMLRRLTGSIGRVSQTVRTCTHRLLDLLDAHQTRATFFVVGNVAEEHPQLIREVARRGHEIGSHTHRHLPIFQQTRAEFRDAMDGTVKLLQDLSNQPILGFRAPLFSVGSVSHWCFEVLGELGFAYDSSVFPVASARYGIANCPVTPFKINTPSGPIVEFPIASWEVLGKRIPVGGGSYFRFLPIALLRRAFKDLERQRHPAVLYFHPYEFHDGLLEVGWRKPNPVYLKYLVLHNLGTPLIAQRLTALLREHHFGTLRRLYEGYI